MSLIDIGLISLQYGPSIVLIIGLSFLIKPVLKWVKDVNRQFRDYEENHRTLKKLVTVTSEACHTPIGEIDKRVEYLEKRNTLIEKDLSGIRVTLDRVDIMTKQMHDHFFNEGLKAGRRLED